MTTALLTAALVGTTSIDPKKGMHLVFDQDFSKLKDIDEGVWLFDDGPVYNNEIEKYTKKSAKNAWIENGCLVLEARKENGKVTSARLQSRKAFKYGFVEATVKVPIGKGTWPAFWMLGDSLRKKGPEAMGWPQCGEIDIMENVGYDPSVFHFSLHSQDVNWMKKEQRTKVASADPSQFHRFGLEWKPGAITFWLDNKPVYSEKMTVASQTNWPFNDKFYIILNLAMGGSWGAAKGIDESVYPAKYLIKNVRVWQTGS